MKQMRKWQRIIELANVESSNDDDLIARLLKLLAVFDTPLRLSGSNEQVNVGDRGYHPSIALAGREMLSDLHILLRGLARGATRAQGRLMRGVLDGHRKHIENVSPPTWFPARLRGATKIHFAEFRVAKRIKDAEGEETIFLEAKESADGETLEFYRCSDPLDLVCKLILDQDPREPVGICKRRACGKFFVRTGRRAFCCVGCKARHWRPQFQMSREERRTYQRKYRAELGKRGPTAIRKRHT